MSDPKNQSASPPADAPSVWRLARTPVSELTGFRWLQRQSDRRLIQTCGLPEPVRELLSSTVRRTRLWRRERIEVARELISHFEEGMARGASESEMIGRFGDPRQVAVLIRRARKRLRPLWWQAWRRSRQAALCALGLLLVAYLYSAARMYTGTPVISHDYLADMNARAVAIPEGERAWPIIREALLAIGPLPEHIGNALGETPDSEKWPALRDFLVANRDSLTRLHDIRARSGLGYVAGFVIAEEDWPLFHPDSPYQGSAQQGPGAGRDELSSSLIGVLLPHLAKLRVTAQLTAADVQLAAIEGNSARVLAGLETMLALPRLNRETPTLINDLVSIAILTLTVNTIAELLHEQPEILDDASWRNVAHALMGVSDGGPIRVSLVGERAMFEDVLQRLYTDDGEGGGRLTASGFRGMLMMSAAETEAQAILREPLFQPILPLYGLIAADRADIASLYDELITEVEREGSLPLWQRGESRIDRRLEALASSWLDNLRYKPVLLLVPALSRISQSAEIATQIRDAVVTAIGLELWKREHGGWPARLEDLVPSILPSVPIDRFDGAPLRYRFVDGTPLLYGVGTDLDDDGGRRLEYDRAGPPAFLHGVRWMPAERVAAIKETGPAYTAGAWEVLPDADWVLWPPG